MSKFKSALETALEVVQSAPPDPLPPRWHKSEDPPEVDECGLSRDLFLKCDRFYSTGFYFKSQITPEEGRYIGDESGDVNVIGWVYLDDVVRMIRDV